MVQAKSSHLLSAAAAVWRDVKGELQEKSGDADTLADGAQVPPEDIRKVAKWYQNAITKLGASAAVTGSTDPAMKPVSEEVIKSFTAAVGTLLSLRRGAGPCLLEEIRDVGGGLAEATDQLGAAIGTPEMAAAAAKALDRCKHLERMSAHNRAATRRRLLMSLAQLRDANRELSEALKKDTDAKSTQGTAAAVGESDEDDLMDDMDFDQELEPEERLVVEAVVKVINALEETLKQASQACMPSTSGSSEPAVSIAVLEVAAKHSARAAHAVDGLAAHALGGLDLQAFGESLTELREAAAVFSGPFSKTCAEGLTRQLNAVQVALNECAAQSADSK